ncbi:hypothetical protein MRX96_003606 [Rhipicephalus microplus]
MSPSTRPASGIPLKRVLVPGAVPMVYPAAAQGLLEPESAATVPKRQRDILLPAVHKLWEREQHSLLNSLMRTGAQLSGDSRTDSPGYSAKYGTYSLLDTSLNRITDMQLVQSNEVTSSSAMELEGLKRALKGFD